MSRLDLTTQELLLRLGPTSHARSAKAELLFRRLRLEKQDQIADALMRAPKLLGPDDLAETAPRKPRKKKNPVEKKTR